MMRTTALALLTISLVGAGAARAAEPVRLDDQTMAQVTAGARAFISLASASANAIAAGSQSTTSTAIDLATRLGGSRSKSSSKATAAIGSLLSTR